MTHLLPNQIAALAYSAMGAGTPVGDVAVITAICLCESGGDTNAYNPHATNAAAYGLWQMNEGLGSQLYNPGTAAQHMAESYHRSRWRYWGCGPDHRSGYLPFMAVAAPAAALAVAGKGPILASTKTRPCTNGDAIHFLQGLIQKNPDKYQTFHSGGDQAAVKAHNIKVITAAATALTARYGVTQAACIKQALKDFYFQDPGLAVPFGFLAQLDLATLIGLGPPGSPGSIAGGLNPFDAFGKVGGAIAGLVNLLGSLFKGSTWVRIAEVVGGMFLVAMGIYLISKDLGLSGVEEAAKKYPGITQSAAVAAKVKGG